MATSSKRRPAFLALRWQEWMGVLGMPPWPWKQRFVTVSYHVFGGFESANTLMQWWKACAPIGLQKLALIVITIESIV